MRVPFNGIWARSREYYNRVEDVVDDFVAYTDSALVLEDTYLNYGSSGYSEWTQIYTDSYVEGINDLTYVDTDILFSATSDSSRSDVYKSTDNGLTWENSTNLFLSTSMYRVEYLGNDTIIAGTAENGNIYRTTDLGDNWVNLGVFHGMDRCYSLFDYDGAGICFYGGSDGAAADNRILRSTDYGLTWDLVYSTGSFSQVICFVDLGNGVLLAGGEAGGASSAYIIKSIDAGLTWAIEYRFLNLPSSGESFEGVESLIYIDGIVYAGMGTGNTHDQVWKSSDDGTSWEAILVDTLNGTAITPRASINNVTSKAVTTMSYDSENGILYAGIGFSQNNAGYLCKSSTLGTSWDTASIGGTTKKIGKILVTNGEEYRACTSGGSSGTPQIWAITSGTSAGQFDIEDSAATLEVWVKFTQSDIDSNDRPIIGKTDGSTGYAISITDNGTGTTNEVNMWWDGSSGNSITNDLSPDVWHQIVVTTDDGSGHDYYIDGVATNGGTSTNPTIYNGDFQIGAWDTDAFTFLGEVGFCAIYKRELKEEEVTHIYNNGEPIQYGSLPCYYKDYCSFSTELDSTNSDCVDKVTGLLPTLVNDPEFTGSDVTYDVDPSYGVGNHSPMHWDGEVGTSVVWDDDADFNGTDNGISISGWFRIDPNPDDDISTDYLIWSYEDTTADARNPRVYAQSTGNLRVAINSTTCTASDQDYRIGLHSFTLTFDSGDTDTYSLYTDSVLRDTGGGFSLTAATTPSPMIGCSGTDDDTQASYITTMVYHTRVLSALEVTHFHNSGTIPYYASMDTSWKTDVQWAIALSSQDSSFNDISGNSRTKTVNGTISVPAESDNCNELYGDAENVLPTSELLFVGDSGFVDLSSNAYDISNASATINVADLNGHDTFDFGGSSYFHTTNTIPKPADYTVATVLFVALNNSYAICGGGTGGTSATWWGSIRTGFAIQGDLFTTFGDDVNYKATKTTGDVNIEAAWHVIMVTYSSGDALSKIYIDDVLQTVADGGGTATSCSGSDTQYFVGRAADGSFGVLGKVAEHQVYDSVLSDTDRTDRYNELKTTYNL